VSELPATTDQGAVSPSSEGTGGLEHRSPEIVTLGAGTPDLEGLFTFMRDAELRVESLRMRIVDRTTTTAGDTREISEVWMRHPGRAKVITRLEDHSASGLSRDYRVWLTDGEVVRTYDSTANVTTVRPRRSPPKGITDPALPSYARVYTPYTDLPMETLADTFIHPHGFCRNVLTTGRTRVLGATHYVERGAFLLHSEHPRTTHVLTDRPDRWLEVGVDRATGFILALVEHVRERVTRDAEVTDLELDDPFADDVFGLHLSESVRTLY
jgi:hypothetical protein